MSRRARWSFCSAVLLVSLLLPGLAHAQGAQVYLPLVQRGLEGGVAGEPALSLIRDAEEAGTITHEQALTYSVLALFGDPRLPAQFRGQAVEDSLIMAEVRAAWPTLSASTRAMLAPFFLPPAAPGSWYDLARPSSSGLAAQEAGWRSVTASSGAKIWYDPVNIGDDATAQALAYAIDGHIYASLQAVMNRHWLSDAGLPAEGGQPFEGGDGRLDIYLVPGANLDYWGLATPYLDCEETPVWINLVSDRPLGGPTTEGLVQTAAHELMHAVLFSYPLKDACGSYVWLHEATAKWFEHRAYPEAQTEHAWAPSYLSTTHESLEQGPNERHYGAYLYPFFVTEKLGSSLPVRQMWQNAGTMDSLKAVDQSGAAFADYWKDFALANWNQGPATTYQGWDSLLHGVEHMGHETEVAGVVGLQEYQIWGDIPHLSAWYAQFFFTDETARSIIFYNGLTYNLTHEVFNPPYQDDVIYQTGQALPADSVKKLAIQALIKYEGNPAWQMEDWTTKSQVSFCRDVRAERIQELVLIVTNAEHDSASPNYNFNRPGQLPTLLVSDMGCWRWEGWVERDTVPDPGANYQVTEYLRTENLVFERQAPGHAAGTAVWWQQSHHLVSGTISEWTYHNTWGSGCTADYSIVGPMDLTTVYDPDSDLLTYLGVTSGANKNAYRGYGWGDAYMETQAVCPGGDTWRFDIRFDDWWETNHTEAKPYPTVINGTLMEGTWVSFRDGYTTWTWHFEAQRQP